MVVNSNNDLHLSVRNLSIAFKQERSLVTALFPVSFDLHRGKALGIVGESGSGKSITALSIMQLIPGSQGEISSGEINLYLHSDEPVNLLQLTEKEMRSWRGKRIAMIFQEPMTSLNPSIKCGKQVMEVLMEHENISRKKARERVIELFREVLLPRPEEMFQSYPHQLSGGQKQRVMIAMAISCNPEILIADEPTTALDVTVQKAILQLLKKLQEKYGMSLVFISHDLGVIAEIAEDVIVMNKGRIVERGKVTTLFNHPVHPYTKGLLACRPPLNIRPVRLPVVADFMEGRETIVENISFTDRLKNHQHLYARSPLLRVENVSTYFAGKRNFFGKSSSTIKAVDNVTFEVYPGETLGLVGESGCGKTTLGRTLLRLVEPTQGKIYFNEIEISTLKRDEMRKARKRMQIIFQDPYSSLNPRMIAGLSIMEPMKVHNLFGNDIQRKARVMEILDKVGLEASHYYRYPHEFSGGQRQRICIARALAVEPDFIVCDESVSALDVSVQAQVLNLLNDLKREFGFTYIFISHDLSVVRYMSDRMCVMKEGRIQEMGEADQVYEKPVSEYTRLLINAIPKGAV